MEQSDRLAFAGAFRGAKYPQRAEMISTLFDPALARRSLDIYDRHADHPDRSLAFPERYQSAVRGQLSYNDTVAQYRRYAGFLNVNTADSSPTMMSRRVFEILASRTPVLSSPSPAIVELGGGHVLTAANASEAKRITERLLADVDFRTRTATGSTRSSLLPGSQRTSPIRPRCICRPQPLGE